MSAIAPVSHQTPPVDLNKLVQDKFEAALASGHVVYGKTESKNVKNAEKNEKYWVTYAPSLSTKPEKSSSEVQVEDPFAKSEPELTVLETLNDDYKLVLNKYPVIPNHLLLVTKEFKSQTSPLSPKDLFTAYKLLQVLDGDDNDDDVDSDDEDNNKKTAKRHVAFYNCGANSGSSVDHKHLQILVLPEKLKTYQDKTVAKAPYPFIPNMMKEPLQNDKVGFSNFVVPLPSNNPNDEIPGNDVVIDEDYLAMVYVSMLQRTLSFFQDWGSVERNDKSDLLPVSYNFMMTKKWMCLVPRSSSFGEVEVPIAEETEEDLKEEDATAASTPAHSLKLGFNATGYLNMILVKDLESKQKVHSNSKLIDQLLTNCSFENSSTYKPDQYDY